jgi:sugar phosphate isomerase/epimerase
MTTRRGFLGTLAAAAAFERRAHAAASAKPPLGLQLYSVRNQLTEDVTGTLKLVRDWGFEQVESFGDYGTSIAGTLKQLGLRCSSIHVDYDRLTSDLDGVLKQADALGVRTIVNPYLPHKQRPFASREEILSAAGDFAKWSRACRAAGKRFAYHTHGQEFGKTDHGTLFDVLAAESGPEVGFEADVFWVRVGGVDPVQLMSRYPGRFWFTHLKDMAKGANPAAPGPEASRANVVLGTGKLDIKGIVAAGARAGVEINYIEDESPDVLTQVPQSVAYYKSL